MSLETYPWGLMREVAVSLATVALILGWAMIFPVGCEPEAISFYAPNLVKAHWLLIAMQENLSYPTFGGGVIIATTVPPLFVLEWLLAAREEGHPISWRK